mgnify:CR=1 FL=1
MAGGIWGVRREQCWVETDVPAVLRFSREAHGPKWDKAREVVDLAVEPCPTISATRCAISNETDSKWCVEETMSDVAPAPERQDVPPYRVPSMAEVAAVPSNGLRVVSTFSGCGGSCLGFEMAGFRIVFASEFVEAARATYALNHPGVPIDERDVRIVTPEDVLAKIEMGAGELDVLEGSPPCASFSTAGKREKGWGKEKAYSDTTQRADDLFFEYARLLKGMQPRMFVAENVSGLVKGKAKGLLPAHLPRAGGRRLRRRVARARCAVARRPAVTPADHLPGRSARPRRARASHHVADSASVPLQRSRRVPVDRTSNPRDGRAAAILDGRHHE